MSIENFFGYQLSRYRCAKGMSESDLAEKLPNLTADEIHEMEWGKREVSLTGRRLFADILDVPHEERKAFYKAPDILLYGSTQMRASLYREKDNLIKEFDAFAEEYGVHPLGEFAHNGGLYGGKPTTYDIGNGKSLPVFQDRLTKRYMGSSYFLQNGGGSQERAEERQEELIKLLEDHLFEEPEVTVRQDKGKNGYSTGDSWKKVERIHTVGWFDRQIEAGTLTADDKSAAREEWDALAEQWKDLNARNFEFLLEQKAAKKAAAL